MTIEQALIYAKKEIHSDHAKILLGDLLNLNPLELLVHLNDEVPEDKMKIYTKEIEALKNNKYTPPSNCRPSNLLVERLISKALFM